MLAHPSVTYHRLGGGFEGGGLSPSLANNLGTKCLTIPLNQVDVLKKWAR